ncbi:MAG TPA: hypothetical protein VJV75_07320 [Candidatus Polarisedimenticolia bacterium]|nr:hypothetical protein [Candidatus Polarisedimenticolia bacterium]
MNPSRPSGVRPPSRVLRVVAGAGLAVVVAIVAALVIAPPADLAAAPSAAAPPAAPQPAPTQYTMTDLGTLRDGLESHAQFINKRGQVAGMSYIATGEPHHFFWDGDTMHDLGADIALIVGLNDQGQIAVNIEAGPYTVHAGLWSDGVLTDFGTLPGDQYSQAKGINNRGQVVGYSAGSLGSTGIIWENGTTTTLGFLGGGDDTFATHINDMGQVAGWAVTDLQERHAFFWDHGVMTDLSPPPPQGNVLCHCTTEARGLNNRGQVVVNQESPFQPGIPAFVWEAGSRTLIVHPPGSAGYLSADRINDRGEVSGTRWTFPGTGFADNNPFFWREGVLTEWNEAATTSQSNAMNRFGQVVGETTTSLGVRGFVWDAGQLTELENESYSSAAGINDRGVIAGSAAIGRWTHAVIWTPVTPAKPAAP